MRITARERLDVFARALLVLAFGASLCLPVAWEKGGSAIAGWWVLLLGWLGVFTGQLGWFGNVALVRTLYVPPKSLFGASIQASLFVVFFLFAFAWRDIPLDNGDHAITRYGAGYYIWLGEMLLGALFCLVIGLFSIEERGETGISPVP
jgi:hypothetical protein